jgi:hypothetical protein
MRLFRSYGDYFRLSVIQEEHSFPKETTHALSPEINCAVLDDAECKVRIEGVGLFRGLAGPSVSALNPPFKLANLRCVRSADIP